MESEVEEIKKKLDIVDVISHYLPLKKRGRHYVACCPFHGEKTPSFTVSPELQIFKCFGCGKAGDIFTFVQEYDRVDFKDALEDMAKMAGVVLKKDPQISAADKQKKRLVDLNYEVAKFYNYILLNHPLGKNALDYVLKRGITSQTIKLFKIGFSPSNTSLIVNYLHKKKFTDQELIATGTFGLSQYSRQSTGSRMYDRFQDRLVFPLADFRDRILGFSGRILPSEFRSPGKTSFDAAKYINSPETDIYHKSQMLFGLNLAKESIKKQNSVLIVEGEFDMISPYQHGVTNVVALKGTAFTADQLQLLHRYTDTLILGLDSDFAGNNAARKSIELADSMEFDIKVLDLGDKYKDPDETIQKDFPFFEQCLKNPIPVWDFIITSALKANDISTIRGKKEVLSLVLPFLVKITNSVIRSDYLNKLAAELGSTVEAIIEESGKYKNISPVVSKENPITVSPSSTLSERLEERLLTLVFSSQKPLLVIKKIIQKFSFTTPRFQSIVKLLSSRKIFRPQKFMARLAPELQSTFQSLYLEASSLNLDSRHRQLEIKKTVNQLLVIGLKDKLSDISSQISRAESSNNESLVEKLEQEYNQTLADLSLVQARKT